MHRLIWIGIAVLATSLCAQAQWLNNLTPGAPRSPDGKVIMNGPVPRVNGKPDLSGVWQAQGDPRAPNGLFGLGESENSRYFRDVLADFKPGEEPLTPEGREILRRNTQPGVIPAGIR